MLIFDFMEKFKNLKNIKPFVIFWISFLLQIYLIDWLIIDSYVFVFWI